MKMSRFLVVSLLALLTATVGTLGILSALMSYKSREAVGEIGTIYMEGMSNEMSEQFENTIELRMSSLASLIKLNPDGSAPYGELIKNMEYQGTVRDYQSLGFMLEDSSVEMIYGDMAELPAESKFFMSLKNGDKKIAVGTVPNGERVVMIGIPEHYRLPENRESIAVVATVPISYISDALSLDEKDILLQTRLIRSNGSFIVNNTSYPELNNYFDVMREMMGDTDEQRIEQVISELSSAMEKREIYNNSALVNGQMRHIFASPLKDTEWYLITVMPFGSIDSIMESLGRVRLILMIACMLINLAVLVVIFVIYYRSSRKQMKLLEAARLEAEQANRAKSEFLSNMSHDIRTPMNAIVGMTAIAMSNIDNRAQVESCLEKISVSNRHLLGLINDVLDMSKIESGKMTLSMSDVSLREVMDGIVSIVQPQVKNKRQKFNVSIENIEHESVYCDSVRLNQVILNLISNAVKFTPDEGNIEVRLYEEKSPKGENFARYHLEVRDNGIGMTEEFQKTVFDAFAREDTKRVHKTEGTGLGMAITKYIVDAMKGEIRVESKQGKGTCFYVTLDLEIAEEREEDMILPNWHMLVVDDDELICKSASDALEKIGINAEWTLDGESAIKQIEDYHDINPYHIILLDWKLPGIDGIETARRIREKLGNDIPIMLISAYDWSDIEKDAREAGISGFIAKPLFKSTLYYGLKKYASGGETPSVDDTITAERPDDTESFDNVRILLAEDNDLNSEIANELLSDLGLVIDNAKNGRICKEMFENSEIGYYKAILMDIRMPEMSGYEAAEAIRQTNRPDSNIPIIAMTADAFSEDVKKCLDAGMNAHTSKPIDVKEVAKLLKKFINQNC